MLTAAIDRAAGLFARLAARPGYLLAACLAANTLFLPYAGISRDAKQYAAQVVQAATGRYANDIFFRYGDQSRGTVLPALLAPAAARVGVEPLFFAVYLVVNAARLWAAQRLVLRVFGPTPGAAAGLLLAAAAPVPIGWGTFAVNEPVLTARAPAVAAALFGLDALLARRFGRAAAWLALGLALHPLMTAPAAAVAVGWVALGWATTPRRRVVVAAGLAVVGAAVGAYLVRTAGSLDAEWRELVLFNNPHVDPGRWDAVTWARLIAAAGCAVAAARGATRPGTARFLALVVFAAAAGLAVAAVAARGPWALVFQGQAARAVWLLELLWFPLAFVTAGRLWALGGGGRAAAVALLVLMLAGPNLTAPAAARVLAAGAVVGLVAARVVGPDGWVWRGLAAGLVVWGAVWFPAFAPAQVAAELASSPFFAPALLDRVHIWHTEFGPLPRLAVVVAALLLAAARPRAALVGAAAAWAAGSAAAYLLPRTDWAAAHDAPRAEDVRLVREAVAGAEAPSVYWPGGRMDTVWFGVGANSYFTYWQLSPNIFFRGNAVEGRRRWGLAAPFEADPVRTPTAGPPTADEFRALVADPALDFVVLPYDFGGWVGTNGAVWVYDARRLRAAGP